MAKINSGLGPIANFLAMTGKHEDIRSSTQIIFGRTRDDFENISQYFLAVVGVHDMQNLSPACGVVYESHEEGREGYSKSINPDPYFAYISDFKRFCEYVNTEGSEYLLTDTPIRDLGEGFCYWDSRTASNPYPLEVKFEDLNPIIACGNASQIPTNVKVLFNSFGACGEHRGNKPYPYCFIAQPKNGGEILGKSFWAATNGHSMFIQPLEETFYPPGVKIDLHWLKGLRSRAYKGLEIFAIRGEQTTTFVQGNLPSGHIFRVSSSHNHQSEVSYEVIYENIIDNSRELLDNIVYGADSSCDSVLLFEGSYLRALYLKISINEILKYKKVSKWNTHTDMCILVTQGSTTQFELSAFSVPNERSDKSGSVPEEPLLRISYEVPKGMIPGSVVGNVILKDKVLDDGRFIWVTEVSGSLIKAILTGAQLIKNSSLWVPIFSVDLRDDGDMHNTRPLVIVDDTCSIKEGGLCYFLMPLMTEKTSLDFSRLLNMMD